MKTDLYTKAVLTIIAICLSIIVLKQVDIIPSAYANGPTLQNTQKSYGLVPVNTDGSIDVNIKSSSEKMSVNIEEVGGFWVGGNTLPVKIKD